MKQTSLSYQTLISWIRKKARLGATWRTEAIRSQTGSRLRAIQSSLEFHIDQLPDNVHKLEQRVLVAGEEAEKVLSISALRLRQREEPEKTRAGTKQMPVMEVLRRLGNIVPEGQPGIATDAMMSGNPKLPKPLCPVS